MLTKKIDKTDNKTHKKKKKDDDDEDSNSFLFEKLL
jgi:hypothetical protein